MGFERTRVSEACHSRTRFASDIICMANGRDINAKDAMSVMSLRAKPGPQLHILAAGPDEIEALEALSAMLRAHELF